MVTVAPGDPYALSGWRLSGWRFALNAVLTAVNI
jgi:hypothetical protein